MVVSFIILLLSRFWIFPLNLTILYISGLASPLSVINIANVFSLIVIFFQHCLLLLLLLSRFSRARLCDPIDGSPPGYFSPYVQVFDYHLVWLPILPSIESEFSLEKLF